MVIFVSCKSLQLNKNTLMCFSLSKFLSRGGEGGDSLIKVGMDVLARALGILGVNFWPSIRFWEVSFAWASGFGNF